MITDLSEQIISENPHFRVNGVGQYATLFYEAGDRYPRHYYLSETKVLALRQMVGSDQVRWHRSNVVVCCGEYFVLVVARERVKSYVDWVERNLLGSTETEKAEVIAEKRVASKGLEITEKQSARGPNSNDI